jgi:alanine dehydrogenase
MLRPGQILYTYLHLAPDPEQTAALVKSGAICIAYETITGPGGGLPLLAPMSEVAGRMAVQAGAAHLENPRAAGVLLGGVPGVQPARGDHRRRRGRHQCAADGRGPGRAVTVLDKNVDRLRQLDLVFGNRINTMYLDRARHRRGRAGRRPGGRRRADARRGGAQAGDPRAWCRA